MTAEFKIRYVSMLPQAFYTEGPAMDMEGNLYFTTLSGGDIIKVRPNGRQSVWARSSCPNGQVILPNGEHLVCDSKIAAVLRYDADGNFICKEIDGFCGGQAVQVPNDIILDSAGNIYFTDSIRHEGKVGFISSTGEEKMILQDLDYPNGLALSNDESVLFVAESYKNRIVAFDLEGLGKTDPSPRVFAALPKHRSGMLIRNLPDGIKVDSGGNLWTAHYGMGKVHVISPEGQLLQSIKTEFELTSNLFIKENKVFITGGYSEPGPGSVLEIEIEND